LRPASFGVLAAARLFLAQAHRLDLRVGRAHQHQHALHAFARRCPSAMLYSRAAALVAVALDEHLAAAVLGEILAVRLQQRAVLVPDVVLVQLIENRALAQPAVRVLQRIGLHRGGRKRLHPDRGGGAGGVWAGAACGSAGLVSGVLAQP